MKAICIEIGRPQIEHLIWIWRTRMKGKEVMVDNFLCKHIFPRSSVIRRIAFLPSMRPKIRRKHITRRIETSCVTQVKLFRTADKTNQRTNARPRPITICAKVVPIENGGFGVCAIYQMGSYYYFL